MHTLTREIRFSVNPFLGKSFEGSNSYASKPAGRGLALYFSLWVELTGEVNADTGFVVNVTDIDKAVRDCVVPVFIESIKKHFQQGHHVSLLEIYHILKQARTILKDKFEPFCLEKLVLMLNPFRKITIKSEEIDMFYFSEKFEFSAMHTLWNDKFSDEGNFECFGKCANPAGHGHNYIVEVTVRRSTEGDGSEWLGNFENIVDREFISVVDHKNLNLDVGDFKQVNPTVENIAAVVWKKLKGKFDSAELFSVTVWENDRTSCTCCE